MRNPKPKKPSAPELIWVVVSPELGAVDCTSLRKTVLYKEKGDTIHRYRLVKPARRRKAGR